MNVLLIDDHALFRDGILLMLEGVSEPLKTFEAGSFEAAQLVLDEQENLDLVLLDIGLPGISHLDALIYIREKFPDLSVVVLSGSDDHCIVEQALRLGARGYIPKSSPAKIMLSALQLVLAGGVYVPPEIMKSEAVKLSQATNQATRQTTNQASMTDELSSNNKNLSHKLTQRQAEVLEEMAKGKSNKEIAVELSLTESTVRVHISAIFKSFGVSNRTQAVQYAMRNGWVRGDCLVVA